MYKLPVNIYKAVKAALADSVHPSHTFREVNALLSALQNLEVIEEAKNEAVDEPKEDPKTKEKKA